MNALRAHGLAIALMVTTGAFAQGFTDSPTCYSWEGGHKSSGSFSKCNTDLQPAAKKPAPVVAALPPPVVASPIMMPQSAPQVISCAPMPKPIIKPKAKPKPKQQC